MKQDQWFYSEDEEHHVGPVTTDEVVALLDSNKLTPDSLVWSPQQDEWKPIRDVPAIGWVPPLAPPPLPKKRSESSEPPPPNVQREPRDSLDIDEEAFYEKTKQSSEGETEKGLPIRWLNFYVYVRIPLGILISVVSGLASFALYPDDPAVLLFVLGLTAFDLCLAIFLLIGLHRRRLWGWRLNWFVLVLEVLLRPLDKAEDATMYFAFLIAAALFWLLPNAIYFKKRRHLFT